MGAGVAEGFQVTAEGHQALWSYTADLEALHFAGCDARCLLPIQLQSTCPSANSDLLWCPPQPHKANSLPPRFPSSSTDPNLSPTINACLSFTLHHNPR